MSRLEPLFKSVTKKIADLEVRGVCREGVPQLLRAVIARDLGSDCGA